MSDIGNRARLWSGKAAALPFFIGVFAKVTASLQGQKLRNTSFKKCN